MITREFENQYTMRQASNTMMKTVGNTPKHLSTIGNRNANLADFYPSDKTDGRRAATQMLMKDNQVNDEVQDYI